MRTESIDALARSLTGPFAFCGLAVSKAGQQHFAISHQSFLSADARTMFRVASVSKIVVGQTLARLLAARGISWDMDAAEMLGFALRNPAFPDVPITIAALASHTAGLDDAKGYLVPVMHPLERFFEENRFSQNQSGTYFDYSNLGYVVLAQIIENLAGEDFAQATAPMIPDQGGYNWAQVPAERMARSLPTYRRDWDRFVAQIDDPPLAAPERGSVGRYAPQGGLRLSLAGMLDLAEGLAQADATVLWRGADGPGNYLDGVFSDYGAGLQIFEAPSFYPRPLVGHFGNAYGFNGGVWYDAQADLAFAYALNGLEFGDEDDSFSADERAIFETVAQIGDT